MSIQEIQIVQARNMKAKRECDQSLEVVKSTARQNTGLFTKSQNIELKTPGA